MISEPSNLISKNLARRVQLKITAIYAFAVTHPGRVCKTEDNITIHKFWITAVVDHWLLQNVTHSIY